MHRSIGVHYSNEMIKYVHPSIFYCQLCAGSQEFLESISATLGQRQATPWPACQPPTGPHSDKHTTKRQFKATYQPMIHDFGQSEKVWRNIIFFFNKFCLFSFVFHWTSIEFLKTQNLVFAWTTLSCRWSQVRGSKCVYIRIVELLTKYYIRAILCMCVPCYFFLHYFGQSKLHLLNCCILTTNYVAKEFFCTNRRQMAVSVLFHQALLCFVCSKTRSWWVLSLCNATLHTTI